MDFVGGLPMNSQRHDCIMVIVDKLTTSDHFIPVKITFEAPNIAQVFLKERFHLHGVPRKIISDRDAHFTSRFWKSLLKSMGTQLNFNTAYHPETNGQTERVNLKTPTIIYYVYQWNHVTISYKSYYIKLSVQYRIVTHCHT